MKADLDSTQGRRAPDLACMVEDSRRTHPLPQGGTDPMTRYQLLRIDSRYRQGSVALFRIVIDIT